MKCIPLVPILYERREKGIYIPPKPALLGKEGLRPS